MATLKLSTLFDSLENKKEFEIRIKMNKKGMVYTLNKLYEENFVLFVSFAMKNLNLFNSLGIFDYSIQEVTAIQTKVKSLEDSEFRNLCEEIVYTYFRNMPHEPYNDFQTYCPNVLDFEETICDAAQVFIQQPFNESSKDVEYMPTMEEWLNSVKLARRLIEKAGVARYKFTEVSDIELILDKITEACFDAISELADTNPKIGTPADDERFPSSCYDWQSWLDEFFVNYFEIKFTNLYLSWDIDGDGSLKDDEAIQPENVESENVVSEKRDLLYLNKEEIIEDIERYYDAYLARKAYLSDNKQERPDKEKWVLSVSTAYASLKMYDTPNIFDFDESTKSQIQKEIVEECKTGVMNAISHSDLIYKYNIDKNLPKTFTYWVNDMVDYFGKRIGLYEEVQ